MLRFLAYTVTIMSMFTSCYPIASPIAANSNAIQNQIYYLGTTYEKTSTLDAYYDEFAVKKEYVVIGSLTNVETQNYDLESMKNAFIFRAQSVGADAILFDPLELSFNPECSRCLRLKARAIRYVPK